jgi:DNA or RNA helicases of superfamily II
MKLYKYQEKALTNLIDSSQKLFTSDKEDKYILFKAITGAGKTVIAGSYIVDMCKMYLNISFVWLSVGNGGLHEQSMNSLKAKLPKDISIKTANEALTNECLSHKDVLVLNWEAMNTKKADTSTGKKYFDNISMRDGENNNLQELWAKTKENDTKLVLIIDESHNTAGSITSKEIIELISPHFSFEITATPNTKVRAIPTKKDEDSCKSFYVPVNTEEVIDQGVIKKSLILNDIYDNENSNSVIELMIKQSLKKKNDLKKAYLNEGLSINPLCLIQLPDGKDGELLKEDIEDILKDLGVSITNGKLAIWLSGQKKNLLDIEKSTSDVDFLIFKKSVATGWDCPRASILIKLRNTRSEIFDLQTIGRILRMPERKHYDSDILNHGYIYTNADYNLNTGDYTEILPVRQTLKPEFKSEVLDLKFKVQKKRTGNYKADIATFEKEFEAMINSYDLNKNIDNLGVIIKSSSVLTPEFDKNANTNVKTKVQSLQNIEYKNKDISLEYGKFVKSLSDDIYTHKTISNIFNRSLIKIPEVRNSCENVKRLVLLNGDLISEIIDSLKQKFKVTIPTFIEEIEFNFKEDRHTIGKETIATLKCVYNKHFVSQYSTEQTFEKHLEELSNVHFWIKNIDKGDGLSIVYEYNGEKREFYPDYIVKFNDGTIGIFEIKDLNDRDKDTITPCKMEALNEYCQKRGYTCGKVEIKNRKVCLLTLPKKLYK